MLRDAKELIVWASKIEARVDVEIYEDPPDPAQMEALDRLHPDLGTLYNDHSGRRPIGTHGYRRESNGRMC